MYINLDALADLAFDRATPFYRGVPSEVRVSSHAVQRFRERTDISAIDEINDFVDNAIQWGRNITSYTGVYRQFMLERTAHGCWPITYRGLLLLLSPDRTTVITVYPLPYWFFNELPRCNAPENRLIGWGSRFLDRLGTLCNQLFTGKPV